MKVLFLSQIVPYPPHGGVLQRGYNLIRELGRHAQVHLLAFVHPDVLPTPVAVEDSRQRLLEFCATVEYFALWPKRSPAHRAAALATSLGTSDPFSVIAHRSRSFQRRVDEWLEDASLDVVHADTIALAPFVRRGLRLPTVLTHHNIESSLMRRRGEVEPRRLAGRFLLREARKLQAYETAVSPRFDVNVLVSSHDEAALLAMAPGLRTAVVPNGVDLDYFSPDGTAQTPSLIYTGGMNMFANRDAVLHFVQEIWPRIVQERPDTRFVAVGQDPPRELLAAADQDSRIQVTGFVDDIRPYVRQAAVYVVPLRVGGGTRLKVLDAMASAKAMVSTSIGCEGLDVVDGRHLVVAETAATFARATLDLLGAPERRHALGQAARAFVTERYSWTTVGDRLLDAYRLAMAQRARVA